MPRAPYQRRYKPPAPFTPEEEQRLAPTNERPMSDYDALADKYAQLDAEHTRLVSEYDEVLQKLEDTRQALIDMRQMWHSSEARFSALSAKLQELRDLW